MKPVLLVMRDSRGAGTKSGRGWLPGRGCDFEKELSGDTGAMEMNVLL